MIVFKGYLTIIKRNIRIILLYVGIFMFLSIMIQTAVITSDKNSGFKETSLDIAVIDRDGGTLAKGLIKYLDGIHTLVDIPDDKKSMQEALFYRNVEYILIIPDDFEALSLAGVTSLKTTKVPGSISGFYVDQQINTFLNNVRTYSAAGFSVAGATENVLEKSKLDANVKVIDKNGNGGNTTAYSYMFHYMPYLFISVLCFALGLVMIMFKDKEIKRRMLCSSVSSGRQNAESIMAFLVVGIGLWMIAMLLPTVMYTEEFLASTNLKFYLMNSFVLMLAALSLSFFVGMIAKNATIISNIVNVLALGLCFLGGVFVPLSFLGDDVKKVVQFLPTYWYVRVNDILSQYSNLSQELLEKIYKGMGIQLLFAVTCVCAGLAFSKFKEQEKN